MDLNALRDEMLSIAKLRMERYREMIKLAEEKKAVLTDGRHADLLEVTRRFDPILVELAQLEKREAQVIKHLEQVDLARGSFVTPEYEAIQSETRKLALQLRELTYINMTLLDNAMQFVNFSMGMISEIATDNHASDGGNHALIFDTKA